jgi:hypothetical protein
VQYIVSTERLGWPPPRRGLARLLPWEHQSRRVYEDQPTRPTATCHLQVHAESPALCDYVWELLVPIPGDPPWESLHPDLRCTICEEEAGLAPEDPAGRSYRFTYDA